METLKDILPQQDQTPKPLKYLVHLPSTAEALRELERFKAGPLNNPQRLEWAEGRLADCQQRDTITATRPEGCWCLGLGGKEERTTREGKQYYSETCSCSEGLAAAQVREIIQAAEQAKREKYRIDTLWTNAQIPARFVDMRVHTSPLAKTNPELIAQLTRPHDVFEDYSDPAMPPDDVVTPYFAAMDAWVSASWFVYGPSGVGKTCLAVGLARARVESDYETEDKGPLSSLLFVTAPRLLSELRSTYNRSQEDTPTEQTVLDKYIQADLLILDDLGAEQVKNTGWVEDRLYQIIGERHDELRPTIFTSNLTMDALAKRIGERITWRIVEMVGKNIVHLTGPNLRE